MSEAERQSFSVVRRAVEKTRLMVEGGATVSVADVLSKLNAAWTEYGKGELGVAASLVQAAAALYQDKLNRWEILVRQREEAIKQRSVQKFRQVQAVHNPIRTNTRQVPSNFQHLADSLEEKIKKEGKSRRTMAAEPAEQGPTAAEVADDPSPLDSSELLDKVGIRALSGILGTGLELRFLTAKLQPPFSNAAIREQLWQNRSLVFVVTWSNGNRLIGAHSAPLILHFWVVPKTPEVAQDLDVLSRHALQLQSLDEETSESVLLTPADGKTPATPYNQQIRNYIAKKAREFQQASSEETKFAIFSDTVYTGRPFAMARRDTFVLRLPGV